MAPTQVCAPVEVTVVPTTAVHVRKVGLELNALFQSALASILQWLRLYVQVKAPALHLINAIACPVISQTTALIAHVLVSMREIAQYALVMVTAHHQINVHAPLVMFLIIALFQYAMESLAQTIVCAQAMVVVNLPIYVHAEVHGLEPGANHQHASRWPTHLRVQGMVFVLV